MEKRIKNKNLLFLLKESHCRGIISGGADDDPSAIATFSQAGAQFVMDSYLSLPNLNSNSRNVCGYG
jgi:hypothetical protein